MLREGTGHQSFVWSGGPLGRPPELRLPDSGWASVVGLAARLWSPACLRFWEPLKVSAQEVAFQRCAFRRLISLIPSC